MFVTLHIKTIEGKYLQSLSPMTIKEAEKIFKKIYKDDDNITRVYLTHFKGWNDQFVKNLKGKR